MVAIRKLQLEPGVSTEISNFRRSLPQVIAAFIKNGILFVYGTSTAMPTILIPNLSGNNPEASIILNQEEISWIASLFQLCVPVGCLFSGILTQILGRKRALQLFCLPFLIGFLIFYFATESWHLFFGLSLLGLGGGLIEAPTLSYAAETAEPHLRGALSTTATFFITLGLILTFIMGTFLPWRTVALVNATIPLGVFLLVILIPETPYWLLSKSRLEEAQKSLAWLRGWTTTNNIEKELLEIQENIQKYAVPESRETWKLYTKSSFIKPFLLIMLTFLIGHFSINPMTVYAIEIYNLLEVPISSYYATILNGCINLTANITCVLFVRYCGKRVLVFISLTGVGVCFCIAATYAYISDITNFNQSNVSLLATNNNWIPLVSLVLMGFFSHLMIYTLPWILMGEIYHNEIRDVASGISAGTGYLVGFTANKTFLNLVILMTLPGVFWLYSSVALLGMVLLFFLLPETEGKTLFAISEHYAGGKKLDNKVLKNKKIEGSALNKV